MWAQSGRMSLIYHASKDIILQTILRDIKEEPSSIESQYMELVRGDFER